MTDASKPLSGEAVMSGEQGARPRVLVVRSEELRDRVGAAIEGARLSIDVQTSPSYLSAMGWLTQERVDVVVGPVSAMTGMVSSTAKALRRLAPGTRLIAVAGADERAEASAALTAGFDHCVYEPADATALLSALQLVPVESTTANPEAAQDPAEPAQPEASVSNSANDLLRGMMDPPPAPAPSDEVGDVDLAEAVMRGDGSLVEIALRILRSQPGLVDVVHTPTGQVPAHGDYFAELHHAGRSYGTLSAPLGPDQQPLDSWAAWLACWLALEQRQADLYAMAMRDELTGLWNRRYFDRFLERVLEHAASGRQQVTLLCFDIDNFKIYNDNYGHPAGDEILRSTANLIQSLVREHDVVARIGGDEFAVIFWDKGEPRHLGSQHPDNVIGIAKRFQKAIGEHRFPKLGKDAVGHLTVSGGLAGFPWDGRTPDELLARADAMAMRSKRQGKNAICFGPGAAPNGNGGQG